MKFLPSRFTMAPPLLLCLAAFCSSIPIHTGARFSAGESGSSGGSQEQIRGRVAPPSSTTVIVEGRDVLLAADAEERLGLYYEARRTLAEAAKKSRDIELLRRHAFVEDQYGENAGSAYRRLVEACEASDPHPADYADLLERGLLVSLRDQDAESSEWFSARLDAAGRGGFAALFRGHGPAISQEAAVPGGTRAALRLAGAPEGSRREEFLAAFCRRIDAFDAANAAAFRGRSSDYFKRLLALKLLGNPLGDRTVIRLSATNEESRRVTEKALHLLGWEIRVTGHRTVVEPSDHASASGGQMTAAALGIDEMGMQEALQSGRPFELEITDDRVPVLFDESTWCQAFCGGKAPPGRLTEVFAGDQRVARAYLGLSAQDPETARLLGQDFGLRTLANNYSNLLVMYSAALSTAGGRAAVPGGVGAESVWQELVGVAPAEPGAFFSALLRKDGGELLAFFAGLMQFDLQRQRFFTASPGRAAKFRGLFNLNQAGHSDRHPRRRGMSILDVLARLPIGPDGRVIFPGGTRLWMDAALELKVEWNTGGADPDRVRSTAPGIEDDILLRLAGAKTPPVRGNLSRLASLVAIAGLDAHRKVPLDEAAVSLLAREYARLQWIWPYLASFAGLGSEDISTLVRLERRFRDLDSLLQNDVLGEWDALTKIISLLAESGTLTQEDAARHFRSLCERFLLAASPADFATASLEAMHKLLRAACSEASNPDDAIQDLLMGELEQMPQDSGNQPVAAYTENSRRQDYRDVLNLQRVPSLQTLFALYHAARRIKLEPAAAAGCVAELEDKMGGLPHADFPSPSGERAAFRDVLRSFGSVAGIRAIQEMKRSLSVGSPDPGQWRALADELMSSLNPQVRLALTGIIYARYLRPTDGLIAHDPLFLRKHRFGWLESARTDVAFPTGELISGHSIGSYVRGGFADFGRTAGEITMATHPEVEEYARPAGAIVVGSLRDTHWPSLRDSDLRWVGLKIRAAREWILRAAFDEGRREELRRATLGLLSPDRRRSLFQALERRDWSSLWRQATLSDLYFLCDAYLEMENKDEDTSPTVRALRNLQSYVNPDRLRWLGQDLQPVLGCSDPHLMQLPPYEHYEQTIFPGRLAARAGDFKLYLAEFFDRHGLPAARLGVVAEPLAIGLLTRLRLSDPYDWQSLQEAFHGLNLEILDEVSRMR